MNRIHSLDYLKLVLAILVAFGHTYWLQTNMNAAIFVFGNGLLRVMVPVFCIVAGYFFYSAAARGAGMKWLTRVLGLYLFWMLIYVPFWLNEAYDLASLIKTLVLGYFHLWFMAGILAAGFLILALRKLTRLIAPGLEIPVLVTAAMLCAIAGVAMQYGNLAGIADIGVRKYQNGLFMCFPYVTLGYLYARRVARRGAAEALPARPAVLIALGLGALGLMVEAWLVQARWGDQVMLEIPVSGYLAAPALFLATLGTPIPAPPIRLDPISAAIYFMHVLALNLAHAAGVTHLAGLMLFGVGGPTAVAILMGRFALPGLKRPAREADAKATAPGEGARAAKGLTGRPHKARISKAKISKAEIAQPEIGQPEIGKSGA